MPALRTILRPLLFWALVFGPSASTLLAIPADRLADDRFAHLGVDDGLGGRILDIEQDRQGFLWFALATGLHRYDGGQVRRFLHDPGDPWSMSDNSPHRLLLDSRGALWVGTYLGGLNKWLPEREQFRRISLGIDDDVMGLEEAAPGRLLVVTSAAEVAYEVRVDEPGSPVAELFDSVQSVAVDPDRGALWVFGTGGLREFSLDTYAQRRSIPWPFPVGLETIFLEALVTGDGAVWSAGYRLGVVRFDPDTGDIRVFGHTPGDPSSLTGADVTSILEDAGGRLWISSFSGLNRFQPETGTFLGFIANPISRRGLANQQIHRSFEDRTGQLWLATDNGASRYDPLRENLLFYSYDPTREGSVPAGGIRSFDEDEQGRLWVGSRSYGLARLDRRAGETVYFTAAPGREASLPDNTIWAIQYEPPGRLWVGTESGLSALEVGTGVGRFYPLPTATVSDRITSLLLDRRGTLWAAGYEGLYRLDRASESLEAVPLDSTEADLRALEDRINDLVEGSSGQLYLATEAGVLRLEADGRQSRLWPIEDFAVDSNVPSSVSTLAVQPSEDGQPGELWACTLEGGLFQLDPSTDRWRGRGLDIPEPFIQTMEAGADGTLWISSGLATHRLDLSTGALNRFGVSDGFPEIVHLRASYQSPSGELFFGGSDGFVAFDPKHVRIDGADPSLVLAEFSIGDRSILPRAHDADSPLASSITVVEDVVLRHFENDFSIELAALHFGDQMMNRYA
ncbi:MAG: two-component regulator propeller domain-containing protein, partial [Acidobacteriota bacterium]